MNPKFLVVYIVAGSLAFLLVIYQLITEYPAVNVLRVVLNVIMCLFFFYLAYKTYHEKKDKELM